MRKQEIASFSNKLLKFCIIIKEVEVCNCMPKILTLLNVIGITCGQRDATHSDWSRWDSFYFVTL